jgi:hypothetical protein
MILGWALLATSTKLFGPPTLSQIDAMAQRRDVDGLTALLDPLPKGIRNPFRVLKTGGAYAVGSKGWHAADLADADGKEGFVVVWTPLTAEDVGEIVLRRMGDRLRYVPESDPLGAKIERHRFDLRFDIPSKKVFVIDRITLHYDTAAPPAILFRMGPNYLVRSILDSHKRPIPFRETAGVVSMRRTGEREDVIVKYDAVVNLPDYAGSISAKEATLVNEYWYPMIARWPAPYEVTIHSPKGWTSVAQGEQLSDKSTPFGQVTRYRMDLPVTYYSLISGPFKSVAGVYGGRKFTTWSTRATEEAMAIQDELYGTIFNFYSNVFGPPPYPQFGYVDSQTYGGGALEAYTFATWGGGGVPQEDAHEPSHTWWGGIVDNTYLHSFWNESFADFSDGLYHRNVPIGNREERRLAFIQDGNAQTDFNRAAMAESGADIGPPGSSLGYGKGAKVLQMLEQWLGTDRMIAAMHEWATTQPRGVPGEWEDFERVVTALNPHDDIRGFFDDWVRRPGYADFDADASWSEEALTIKLSWHGPRFRMPLTIMVRNADGRSTFSTVTLGGKTDRLSIPLMEKPTLVSIDPWRQALRQVDPEERPVELAGIMGALHKVVDPSHRDWLTHMGGAGETAGKVDDPAGLFIVGSPETLPEMAPLCAKAGFVVHGNSLTYDGTTIDLTKGCALAVVDLEGGKQCVIGLGKTRVTPDPGRARLVLTDGLGRFLRGVTEPKTKGKLTFRL